MNAATHSQQVCWWAVAEFVAPWLVAVDSWPMAGSVEWQHLADDDPRKWCSLLDAARHWSLRVETCQEQRAEASRAVSTAVDWRKVAGELTQRRQWRAGRPWAKRVTP